MSLVHLGWTLILFYLFIFQHQVFLWLSCGLGRRFYGNPSGHWFSPCFKGVRRLRLLGMLGITRSMGPRLSNLILCKCVMGSRWHPLTTRLVYAEEVLLNVLYLSLHNILGANAYAGIQHHRHQSVWFFHCIWTLKKFQTHQEHDGGWPIVLMHGD